MATIKTILELLRILVAAYRYISNEIDRQQFQNIVEDRKVIHDKYLEAERKEKLRILRDKVK